MKIAVTKRITFEASHFLHNSKFNEKENKDIFHACSGIREGKKEMIPHGHSYKLEVTVIGEVDKSSGFLIDFKKLKQILKEEIDIEFDHKCINWEVKYFVENPQIVTTVENMGIYIFKKLQKRINDNLKRLYSVKIWETEDSYATITEGDVDG